MSDQRQDQVDGTAVDAVGMGVSSERVGHTGPDQVGTAGIRDTSAVEPEDDAHVPPEQRPGQVERNAADVEPKADRPGLDPHVHDD